MANNLFIDPTSLSTPSSPSGSLCTYEDIDPTHSAGPARKRVRSQDMTTEERKEARAHRNRIAAQNSRDRRKAYFTYLERRVAELEEENRLLHAGADIRPTEPTCVTESDRARERENEELKERIRTLERGWDVVLKALAAQGLPNGLSSTSTTTTKPSSPTVEPPLPIPKSTGVASFPSPAPSHSSLVTQEVESNPTTPPGTTSSGIASSGTGTREESKHVSRETTRHLARVASMERPSVSSVALQRSPVHASTPSQASCKLPTTSTPNISIANNACESFGGDDDVMEALFREIVTSPCTTQDATTESRKVSVAGPESAEVMDRHCGETGSGWHIQLRVMGGTEGDRTSSVYGNPGFHNYSAKEWMTGMETTRMLDEMIAMSGLDDGEAFPAAQYPDIELGLDMSLNLDVSTLNGWDMGAAVECIGAH